MTSRVAPQVPDGQSWLVIIGLIAAAAAILHVAALFGGPAWMLYLHAPDSIIESSRRGTWLAPVSILAIILAVSLTGVYAMSAAGYVPKAPLLRTGLVVVGVVALLRAAAFLVVLVVAPQASRLLLIRDAVEIVSAIAALIVGISSFVGVSMRWRLIEAAR